MRPNDRFAAPEKLISLDQALAYLAERIEPVVGTEEVPLAAAAGRVLAADLVARVTSPPFDNAAMDGFAVRFADLAPGMPTTLRVADRIAAGHASGRRFAPGEAARIFTGAPIPDGLDSVIMQEDCAVEERDGAEYVRVPAGIPRGKYVHAAGQDFAAGATLLRAGHRLRPQDVGIAAAAGAPRLSVFRRLRLAVFSTGDEVREPGEALPAGAIYGSNRYALISLAAGLGCAVSDLGNLPDDVDTTARALSEAARGNDLLLTTGGVSVGGEDHVRAAVERDGAIHLWRMLLKPGKPTALGNVGAAAFIGLPGYPVSAQVMFMILARPLILRLSGATREPMSAWRFRLPAAFAYDKNTQRREFVRARLEAGADGAPRASLFRSQESSLISSLVESDGLIDLREEVRRVEPGAPVDFIPYQTLQW